ncbi:MAG: VanW family protein [Clostridium sp.]|nr:VanW family protein [Clostridium sp.]
MKKRLSFVISVAAAMMCLLFAFNAYADEEQPVVIALDASNTVVSLSSESYTYNGKAHTPKVTVIYNEETLVEDTDYTVEYQNNNNAGTAKAVVTGVGNYSGSISKSFKINAKSIKPSVSLKYSSTTYTGKALKPTVTVKDGSTKLGSSDYSVSYKNNTKPGIATVTINGKGNYKFSATKTFKITPKAVSGFKMKSNDTTSITLSWSKMSDISQYRVYVYDKSKKDYKYVATTTSTSYKVKKLTAGKAYTYRIRAVKKVDDKYVYGSYTKCQAATKPKSTTLTSVTKSGTTLKAKWNKVNCSGYLLFYSTDSSFKKNVKYVTISGGSKTSYSIKKLNKKSTYYCKVQPYTLDVNKKKHYASKSAKLSTNYGNLYASYSSNYVNNANRTTNLQLASKAIDGTVVKPGETFSFNKVVGQRTSAKGYKPAPIFAGSGVEDGVGGGICQVASTMFNTALNANVKITERHQHNQRVAYVPLGRDAAIYWGSQDFKWTNNTKYPIKIKMTVSNGTITCKFYTSTEVSPKKVSLKVTQSGKNFTLKRTVNGKVNYSCKSKY